MNIKIISSSFLLSVLVLVGIFSLNLNKVSASGVDLFSGSVQMSPTSVSSGQSITLNIQSPNGVLGNSYEGYCTTFIGGESIEGSNHPPKDVYLDTIIINNTSYDVSGSEWRVSQSGNAGDCSYNRSDYNENIYTLDKTISISSLPAGTYPVRFVGTNGPISDTNSVYESFDVTPLTLTVTATTATPVTPTGTICVNSNESTAWTISGPTNASGQGASGCSTGLNLGSYTVTANTLSGYTGPTYSPAQNLSLESDGQTITSNLTYTANGSALCQDSQASNYNGPLPCNYNNNVNLYFYVRDLSTQAFISGANVAIVPTANTTTDSSGLASFQVAKNTNVTYTVSKSGCDSSSGSINSGSTGNTANVNLNCASAPPPPGVVLTITVSGSGTVATTYDGSTYSCSSTCSYSMNYGTYVSLVESPGSGSSFSSWAGACSGTSSTCARTISSDTSVTATFTSSGGGSAPVGSISFSINYVLIPNFDYSLSNSGSVSVNKSSGDAYGQSSVSKTLTTGSTQAVDLSISGVPSGTSYSIANRTCSPSCVSTITFTVGSGTTVGTYPITVTGSPNSKQTTFNLVVASAPIAVSCSVTPSEAVLGQSVTWTASIQGGTAPFTYSWSGLGVPSPAPSTNPFTLSYSTTGIKTATVTVTDANSLQATCPPVSITEIYFDPLFQEF